jgi:hypothetical protein
MAWASFNQIVCAWRFLYGVTLVRAEMPERIAYVREPRKLPVLLKSRAGVFQRVGPGHWFAPHRRRAAILLRKP